MKLGSSPSPPTPLAVSNKPFSRMELGNLADHKSLGEGVYERRIDFGPGYRVYFGKQGGQRIILLGGGTKKGQQADIARAKHLWKQYKKRKRTGD